MQHGCLEGIDDSVAHLPPQEVSLHQPFLWRMRFATCLCMGSHPAPRPEGRTPGPLDRLQTEDRGPRLLFVVAPAAGAAEASTPKGLALAAAPRPEALVAFLATRQTKSRGQL